MLTVHLHTHPNLLDRVNAWTDGHSYGFLEFMRVVAGFILLQKGLYFISNMNATANSLAIPGITFGMFWFAHYLVFAHLVGGVMLILGFWSRLASLVQLPILLGAVILAPYQSGSYIAYGTSLSTAWFTLALLMVIAVFGSGFFSMDHYLSTQAEATDDPADENR